MKSFAAAAQHAGIARFEAQSGGIDGHVGARFVNDADHAQGYAHFADLQAVGADAEFVHFAHGIGQGGHLAQAFAHAGDGFFGEREPLEQCGFKAFGGGLLHVFGIGGQNIGLVLVD